MIVRTSSAVWEGGVKGKGTMKIGNNVFDGGYSYASRFESGTGTNPEELIGAAHAGCFSMALALILEKAGYKPEKIRTTAKVKVERVPEGHKITEIALDTEGWIPGISEKDFHAHAEIAKKGCPVSVALAAVEIRLTSRLGLAKAA